MRNKPVFGNYLAAGIAGFIVSFILLWFLMPLVPVAQGYSAILYNFLKAFLLLAGAFLMTYLLKRMANLQQPLKQAAKAAIIFAILYGIAQGYFFAQEEMALCEEAAAAAGQTLDCSEFIIHMSTAFYSAIYCFIVVVVGAFVYFYMTNIQSAKSSGQA